MEINNLCLKLYQYLPLNLLKKIIFTISFLLLTKKVFLILVSCIPKTKIRFTRQNQTLRFGISRLE